MFDNEILKANKSSENLQKKRWNTNHGQYTDQAENSMTADGDTFFMHNIPQLASLLEDHSNGTGQ